MTTTAIEIDETRVAHRKACAFLKGFIVGYSKLHGMKWNGDPDRTAEFRKGWDEANSRRWSAAEVTFVHALYNKIRHGRPHTMDDQEILTSRSYVRGYIENMLSDEFGFDVEGQV